MLVLGVREGGCGQVAGGRLSAQLCMTIIVIHSKCSLDIGPLLLPTYALFYPLQSQCLSFLNLRKEKLW